MRDMRIFLTSVLFAAMGILVPAKAELATPGDAVTVAQNWITLIIAKEGSWGGTKTAQLNGMYDLRRGNRLLGYLFRVEPQGYVVVPLSKEVAPVKAYSATSDFNAESEEGMACMIKDSLAAALDRTPGTPTGQISAQGAETPTSPETDHQATWSKLALDTESFKIGLKSGIIALSYTPGRTLLGSEWNQNAPYNLQCPGDKGCVNCPVGCVALAGAQIMHYWAWPPAGVGHDGNINYGDAYNWRLMADKYEPWGNQWKDGNGKFLDQDQVDAVANLCREVGEAAGTSYSCDGSSAWCGDKPLGRDMVEAYEDHFRYSKDADFDVRLNDSDASWYKKIKDHINANRPLQYCYAEVFGTKHSLVLDGWQEGDGIFQGHMNDGMDNGWVDMANVPGADAMITGIHPDCTVGSVLNGRHVGGGGNFVYFDQDAAPASDTEYIYVHGQFLPGVTLRTDPATGFAIRFVGGLDGSWLYSIKGTSDTAIFLQNGAGIRLEQGGCIRFY